MNKSEKALESCARRAARRVGLRAIKSRQRTYDINHLGMFMLVDDRNWVRGYASSENFGMTANDVIAFCQEWVGR